MTPSDCDMDILEPILATVETKGLLGGVVNVHRIARPVVLFDVGKHRPRLFRAIDRGVEHESGQRWRDQEARRQPIGLDSQK